MSQYTFTRQGKYGTVEKIKAILRDRKLKTPDFVAVGDLIEDIFGGKFRVIEVRLDFEGKDFYSYTAKLEKVEEK